MGIKTKLFTGIGRIMEKAKKGAKTLSVTLFFYFKAQNRLLLLISEFSFLLLQIMNIFGKLSIQAIISNQLYTKLEALAYFWIKTLL